MKGWWSWNVEVCLLQCVQNIRRSHSDTAPLKVWAFWWEWRVPGVVDEERDVRGVSRPAGGERCCAESAELDLRCVSQIQAESHVSSNAQHHTRLYYNTSITSSSSHNEIQTPTHTAADITTLDPDAGDLTHTHTVQCAGHSRSLLSPLYCMW